MAAKAPARRKPRRRAPETIRCEVCRARYEAGVDLDALIGPTLGFQILDWMEKYLVHGPGDVQGEPLVVDAELGHFILHCYELRGDGSRIFRRAMLSRPKGRAKSEIGGAICAAEFLAPVRFDHWATENEPPSVWGYQYEPGEPVGRPIKGPRVLCLATEEDQADNNYDPAAYMLENGKASDEFHLDVGLTRVYAAGGGEIIKDTSAPTSAEGALTTFCSFDETHLYNTPPLRSLHETVRRNLSKRGRIAEPWSLETSNMYAPGEESALEVSHRHWKRIVAGEFGPAALAIDRLGILFDHREAAPVDLDDEEALEAAILEVYGAAGEWIDPRRIIAEIHDPDTSEANARRFYLGQAMRGSDVWLEKIELWDACKRVKPKEPPAGSAIALGFDGSQSDDSTALMACTIDRDGEPYVWPLGIWEAPENPRERAEWTVDKDEVKACVADAFDTFDVCLFYCDPPYWISEIAAWASEYGADVVREFSTARDYRMGPAQQSLKTTIFDQALEHDGDTRVRRHMENARRRPTRHGDCVRKDRPKSPRKIDACVATAIVYQARNDVIAGDLDRASAARKRKRDRRKKTTGGGGLITF